MKVGDLVRRYISRNITGVVVEENEGYAKVFWGVNYGCSWAPKKSLKVISQIQK